MAAETAIQGDTVLLTSDVAKPVYVRYAYAPVPQLTLYNGAGFPASPFTSKKERSDLTYTALVQAAANHAGPIEGSGSERFAAVGEYDGNVTRIFGTADYQNKFEGNINFLKAFDGNSASYFDGSEGRYTSVEFDEGYCITKIDFYIRSGFDNRVSDGEMQASEDGVHYVTLFRFPDRAQMESGGSLPRIITISLILKIWRNTPEQVFLGNLNSSDT